MKIGDYTVIEINKPCKERLDEMFNNIQEYFDTKYSKRVQKKEKPTQNFSLENYTTKTKLKQE